MIFPACGIHYLIQIWEEFYYFINFFLAFSCALLYGFQPFTMNILKVSASQNATLFTIFGVVGFISQTFLVHRFSKALGIKRSFIFSMIFTAISFMIMFFSHSLPIFIVASIILALSNSTVQTLIPTILSQEADEKSQGSIMGLNASYQSIGMIFGPILGGMVATIAIPLPFIVGSILVFICFLLSFRSPSSRYKKTVGFFNFWYI